MRPYLGILKDSFREALASRVLWILLALTTLFLAALAPFSLADKRATRLRRSTVTQWNTLAQRLVEQGQSETPSPGRQVWSRLPDGLKKTLADRGAEAEGDFPFEVALQILDGLNKAIADRSLYDSAAWQQIELNDEARALRDQGVESLSDNDLARFNRLLLEAAFPEEIPRSTASEIVVTYLGWPWGNGLPLTRAQVTPILKIFITGIVNFLVGNLGVFCAILVTASIVPQTFEAGSIDLLLSKPVSRSLVFLTKFAGGGIFIGLIALYLIGGIWLIAGVRFDLWMHRLWWCLPIFLFLFAIYYSVCASAGVLWRNTIVAIVLTIVFWGLCFTVGTTKALVEQIWLTPMRITQVTPAGSARIAVDEQGQFREWQPQERAWTEAFSVAGDKTAQPPFPIRNQILGPVYDAAGGRLLAIQLPPSQGRGGFRLFGPPATLLYAEPRDGWLRKEGPPPPAGARALFFDQTGRLLVVGTDGVFRLDIPAGAEPGRKSGKFAFLGPQPRLKLDADSSVGHDPATGKIVTWSAGQ